MPLLAVFVLASWQSNLRFVWSCSKFKCIACSGQPISLHVPKIEFYHCVILHLDNKLAFFPFASSQALPPAGCAPPRPCFVGSSTLQRALSTAAGCTAQQQLQARR